MWPYSFTSSISPYYRNSSLYQTAWLNACASTEHMGADKVGQEITIGTFLQRNLFALWQVV